MCKRTVSNGGRDCKERRSSLFVSTSRWLDAGQQRQQQRPDKNISSQEFRDVTPWTFSSFTSGQTSLSMVKQSNFRLISSGEEKIVKLCRCDYCFEAKDSGACGVFLGYSEIGGWPLKSNDCLARRQEGKKRADAHELENLPVTLLTSIFHQQNPALKMEKKMLKYWRILEIAAFALNISGLLTQYFTNRCVL